MNERRLFAPDGRASGSPSSGTPMGRRCCGATVAPAADSSRSGSTHAAAGAGLRIVGFDRPGYGLSDPMPGRSIRDVVDDMLVIADALSLDRFATVGCSTGGAYAIAAAALVPDRVLAVVACCSMTDMSWPPGRATMSQPHAHAVWDAPDRDAAIAAAVEAHGENGSKMLNGGMGPGLGGFDHDVFADPAWMSAAMTGFAQMFTHGLEGYADDRIADGSGWIDFDVTQIVCPVCVLHGTDDKMVDVIHPRHTAELIPGAELNLVDGHGHFSIEALVIPELRRQLTG